jgi:glycosyltransferase involved in cell wall biosynthesis
MDPLVSVLMPCYNSAATLPLALASLRLQTYANWECILVDDGSTDSPFEVVEQFRDPRIRLIRQPENGGRAAARQKSVDSARGSLLAMLDADDWIYPEKLRTQVECLRCEPSLMLVSTAMGIVDREGRLTGVRGPRTAEAIVRGRYVPGTVVPCAFAPSMYRAEAGAGIRFDSSFRFAEDADYLSRILCNHTYGVLRDIQYAYTEHTSVTASKMLMATGTIARMYLNRRADFPIRSRWLAFRTFAKVPLYKAAERLGLWEVVLRRRSAIPTAEQLTQFEAAARTVREEVERHFGRNAVAFEGSPAR